MAFLCAICGKAKSSGNHKACSRELQRMYAPGTALHKEQQLTLAGRKASVVVLPSRKHLGQIPRSGFFSRLRKGQD